MTMPKRGDDYVSTGDPADDPAAVAAQPDGVTTSPPRWLAELLSAYPAT